MNNKKLHILIFEDDIDLVFQWKQAFAESDLDISHTNSVANAMELCTQHEFDAIICDLFIDQISSLENEGGLILLHRLEEAKTSKHIALNHNSTIPRIIVSGCSDIVFDTLKRVTDRLGSKLFLLKPFEPEELVFSVIECIEKSAQA